MQPLQICIGPTIYIGRENWCLLYAGIFYTKKIRRKKSFLGLQKKQDTVVELVAVGSVINGVYPD